MEVFEEPQLNYIPSKIDYATILALILENKANFHHFKAIKIITCFTDEKIANWLDISVKTYRAYSKPNIQIKDSIKEHALVVLSVIRHGIDVFGNAENFTKWLETDNFYFDKRAPNTFMHTNSGMKFIDDRLTGMEYGDNA
ncbi:MAG: antitoxin Xre/MbcA/ParS toxin-binding domain-containing protein [Janthinobacterium lividum]